MTEKIKAFISYSHEDSRFRTALLKHLESINKLFDIDLWYDGEIDAGGHIEEEVIAALDNADIILLLISENYISSNFCYNIEMERAFKREQQKQCIIVPILLKDASLNEAMPFYNLKTLPTDRKPVTSFHPHNKGYADITDQLTKIIRKFIDKSSDKVLKPVKIANKPAPKNTTAKFNTNQLFIDIAQNGKISPYQLNQKLLCLITKTNENIAELSNKFNEIVIKHTEKYKEKIRKSKSKKIYQKQQRNMLQLFLFDLFIEIKTWLFMYGGVRIHARGLIENEYNCIFALTDDNIKNNAKSIDIDWTKELKEMSLNSMIHISGILGVPMVKSLNVRQHEKGNNDDIWVDYLTCSFKNIYHSPEPLVSFGISIHKSSKRYYKNLLIVLAYLRIDKWVENTINQYIKICHDVDNTYDIKEIINSFAA